MKVVHVQGERKGDEMTQAQMVDRLDELEAESARGMDPGDYAANIRERVQLQTALGMWEEDAEA